RPVRGGGTRFWRIAAPQEQVHVSLLRPVLLADDIAGIDRHVYDLLAHCCASFPNRANDTRLARGDKLAAKPRCRHGSAGSPCQDYSDWQNAEWNRGGRLMATKQSPLRVLSTGAPKGGVSACARA